MNIPLNPKPQPIVSERRRKVMLAIIASIAGACITLSLCFALVGGQYFANIGENGNAAAVAEQYMRRMAERDPAGAYALFSTRAKGNLTLTDLERRLEGDGFANYAGFTLLQVDDANIEQITSADPSLAQGRIATITATISYQDGHSAQLRATLEQEGAIWRIHTIDVIAP